MLTVAPLYLGDLAQVPTQWPVLKQLQVFEDLMLCCLMILWCTMDGYRGWAVCSPLLYYCRNKTSEASNKGLGWISLIPCSPFPHLCGFQEWVPGDPFNGRRKAGKGKKDSSCGPRFELTNQPWRSSSNCLEKQARVEDSAPLAKCLLNMYEAPGSVMSTT